MNIGNAKRCIRGGVMNLDIRLSVAINLNQWEKKL